MSYLRSATFPGSAFAPPRRPARGRLIAHYIMDLAASVFLVLALGWLFQASASEFYLRNALVTQNEIYVAISRFTPDKLVVSYADTVQHMIRNLAFGYDPGESFSDIMRDALTTVGEMLADLLYAVPSTIIELYHETSGTAAWIVLAGFGMAGGTVFTALLAAQASVWRLLLAVVISPLAISVVFLALQGFMVLMLDAFFWFTWLAPYTVACPVLCTLYWVALPNAERGALATVAHAILRVLEPQY